MAIPIPRQSPAPAPDDEYLGIGLFARPTENGKFRGVVCIRAIKDGVRSEQEYPCGEEREKEEDAHKDALLLSLRLP